MSFTPRVASARLSLSIWCLQGKPSGFCYRVAIGEPESERFARGSPAQPGEERDQAICDACDAKGRIVGGVAASGGDLDSRRGLHCFGAGDGEGPRFVRASDATGAFRAVEARRL